MNSIITGVAGQDGRYLASLLHEKGYDVFGIASSEGTSGSAHGVTTNQVDITEFDAISSVVKALQPDEIYHLAAKHGSSEQVISNQFELFHQSYRVNVESTINLLEAICRYSRGTRLFLASSSQIFGETRIKPQTEFTPKNPVNIYGVTKLIAGHLCDLYRRYQGLYVAIGILFNHESPYRSDAFVSKKIVKGVVGILHGRTKKLALGNLSTEVDWGYAPDYVDAMYRVMQLPKGEDFVISTGEVHTVREFAKIAFEHVGLDWKKYVMEDASTLTSTALGNLVGDNSKLKALTGWKPHHKFDEMVRALVDNELDTGKTW